MSRTLVQIHLLKTLNNSKTHGLAMRILARQHVLKSVGRTPRPLNGFEQKAMYSDIGPGNGGIKATKALVQAYEGAWAQSQGDQPGFPETDEEKVFQKQLIDWHLFHESSSSARSFRISCDT